MVVTSGVWRKYRSNLFEKMNSLTVSLENLSFFAHHGVMSMENIVGNEFNVTLHVYLDPARLEKDITGDQSEEFLEHTVSYADLYEIVETVMKTPCQLLETVAIRASKAISHKFPEISGGKIKICKVTPPIPGITGSASVTYTWNN